MSDHMAGKCLYRLGPETGKSGRSHRNVPSVRCHDVASGLRRFWSEVRDVWRDPQIPPAMPQLRDYPIRHTH